jgi:archaellum biogenesis ATPase FlaH
MFKENFYIFTGQDGNTLIGKTTFLNELAYKMKLSFDKKIAFIAATHELEDFESFLSDRYEIFRFLSYDDKNNRKILESISELCQTGKIDYVFVDDMDSFMPNDSKLADNYIRIIESMPVKKVVTIYTLYNLNELNIKKSFKYSILETRKTNINNSFEYLVDNVKMNEFILSLIREEKINNLLK